MMHVSTVEQFQEAKALFAARKFTRSFYVLAHRPSQARHFRTGRVLLPFNLQRPKLEEGALLEATPPVECQRKVTCFFLVVSQF